MGILLYCCLLTPQLALHSYFWIFFPGNLISACRLTAARYLLGKFTREQIWCVCPCTEALWVCGHFPRSFVFLSRALTVTFSWQGFKRWIVKVHSGSTTRPAKLIAPFLAMCWASWDYSGLSHSTCLSPLSLWKENIFLSSSRLESSTVNG